MSEHITLVNPYVIYECPDCGVRVATNSPDLTPDCPGCGLLDVALEFVGLGEFISAESKAEIERLRREREVLVAAVEARGRFAAHLLSCGACRPIDPCSTGRDLEDEWLVAQDEALALLDGEKGGDRRE